MTLALAIAGLIGLLSFLGGVLFGEYLGRKHISAENEHLKALNVELFESRDKYRKIASTHDVRWANEEEIVRKEIKLDATYKCSLLRNLELLQEDLEKLGSDAQISITREFYPNLDWSILWSEKSPPVPQNRPYTEHVEGTPSRVMEALTLQIKASHYFKNGEVLFPNVPIVMRAFGTAVICERRVKPAIHFVEVIVPVVDAESHNTIVDDMDAKIAAAVEVEMSLNRHRLANAGLIQ